MQSSIVFLLLVLGIVGIFGYDYPKNKLYRGSAGFGVNGPRGSEGLGVVNRPRGSDGFGIFKEPRRNDGFGVVSGLRGGSDGFGVVGGPRGGSDGFGVVGGPRGGSDGFGVVGGPRGGSDGFGVVGGPRGGSDGFGVVGGPRAGRAGFGVDGGNPIIIDGVRGYGQFDIGTGPNYVVRSGGNPGVIDGVRGYRQFDIGSGPDGFVTDQISNFIGKPEYFNEIRNIPYGNDFDRSYGIDRSFAPYDRPFRPYKSIGGFGDTGLDNGYFGGRRHIFGKYKKY